MTTVDPRPVSIRGWTDRDDVHGRLERPVGAECFVSKDASTSREYAQLEADNLWAKVWQVACREEEVAKVGDFVEYTIGMESIIVLRSDPDTIKAFHNVCLHRGTPLKYGCGNARELRCRYHAWRWNLDGSIKEVTDEFDFDPGCVEAEKLRLPECKVDTWGGFVFINMDLGAQPLLDFLDPIPLRMARYEPEKMRIDRHRTTILQANWKTALYAFTDGWHGVGTHPQAMQYMDDTNWVYEAFDTHGRWIMPDGVMGRTSPRLGDIGLSNRDVLAAWLNDVGDEIGLCPEDAAELVRMLVQAMPEDQKPADAVANIVRQFAGARGIDSSKYTDAELVLCDCDVWQMFPNISMPMNALQIFFMRFRPNGDDPNSCLLDTWNLSRPGDDEPAVPFKREYYPNWRDHDAWGRILTQDLQNLENVQRGMRSRAFQDLICGREDLVMWNHDRVLRQYVGR